MRTFVTISSLIGVFLAFSIIIAHSTFAQSGLNFQNQTIDAMGRTAVGDIDGDGDEDVVIYEWAPNRNRAGTPTDLYWYEYPGWTRHKIASDLYWGDDVEIVDIDQDGDMDIVAAIGNGSNINDDQPVIYLHKNGTSGKSQADWETRKLNMVTGQGEVRDYAFEDFDGDGKLDIGARFGQHFDIWYQTTTANFEYKSAIQLQTSEAAEGLGATDVDNDGKIDVIMEGYWHRNPGSRNGTWSRHVFDPQWHTAEPSGFRGNSVKVVTADVNQDGKTDILISDSEENNQPIALYTLKNNADPTSGPSAWTKTNITNTAPYQAHTLQVGDFDGDCDIDVLSGSSPQTPTGKVHIYLNDGNSSSFQDIVLSGSGTIYSAHVGDINRDGMPDIIGSTGWDYSEMANRIDESEKHTDIWINQNTRSTQCGGGGTQPPVRGSSLNDWQRFQIGDYDTKAVFVESADIDGDGNADIIAGRYWWKNPGQITSGNWQRRAIGGEFNMGTVYDFDGDGDQDIFGTTGNPTSSYALAWAENQGNGTFEIKTNINPNIGNNQIVTGDFLQGISVQPGSPTYVYLSWHRQGKGITQITVPSNIDNAWTASKIYATPNDADQSEDLSLGNIDQSGGPDLLLGIDWLQNNGNTWTFKSISSLDGLAGNNVSADRNELADINKDGRLDAVVAFENGTDLVWYEAPANPANSSNWTRHFIARGIEGQGFSLDSGDIDKDGDIDIVLGEHRNPSNNRVIIYENKQNGADWTPHIIDSQPKTTADHHDGTQLVDIDGDNDLDIISIGWNNQKVWLYLNKSTGSGGNNPDPTATPTSRPIDQVDHYPTNLRQGLADYGKQFNQILINWINLMTNLVNVGGIGGGGGGPAPDPTNTPAPGNGNNEVLLFDDVTQFTYADNGFHVLVSHTNPNDHGPNNWISPIDYWNGQFQVRYQIVDHPSNQAGKMQVCIWTRADNNGDGRPDGYYPETCSGQVAYNRAGNIMTNPVPYPNGVQNGGNGVKADGNNIGWYRKEGVLDYSKPADLLIRNVLRGSDGCNVTRHNVAKPCWEEWSKYEDTKVRITIVLVPAGQQFSGWDRYQ